MTACTRTFILWLTIASVSMISLGGCGLRPDAADHSQAALEKPRPVRARVPGPYGKIRVPARLFLDLVESEHGADPVRFMVSASSSVAARACVLRLTVPQIGEAPVRTDVLWAEDSTHAIAEVHEYRVPPLPVGRYHFVAILEFTPDLEVAEPLVVSDSLYLDVRAEEILSSNVSFRQMERIELYRTLQDRAVRDVSAAAGAAHANTPGRRYEVMEAADPDLVAGEIARLRAVDRDVARRVMALNSTEARTESDPDMARRRRPRRPVVERAVPIR